MWKGSFHSTGLPSAAPVSGQTPVSGHILWPDTEFASVPGTGYRGSKFIWIRPRPFASFQFGVWCLGLKWFGLYGYFAIRRLENSVSGTLPPVWLGVQNKDLDSCFFNWIKWYLLRESLRGIRMVLIFYAGRSHLPKILKNNTLYLTQQLQ